MKTKRVSGITYLLYPSGVMVPVSMVRETPTKVRTPSSVLHLLHDVASAQVEHFGIFTLDGNNQVIKRHDITKGLANQSPIHPRETFRPAILDGAVTILVFHNHPSGNLEPSESDLIATRRLVEVAKTIGIPLLDHMIVGPRLTEEGQIQFTSLRERYPAYFG